MKGKTKIDTILNPQQIEELWRLLGKFVDVFAWNKGKFGCCIVEENFINTQGFMLVTKHPIDYHVGRSLKCVSKIKL
jgi:hypothetical protein